MHPRASERYGSFECDFEFAVACGEPAELFEAVEAALDEVAALVQIAVEVALLAAMPARRNDAIGSHPYYVVDDGVAIVPLVGNHGLRLAALQQRQGLSVIAALAASDAEPNWFSISVSRQMHLGRQSTSGTPQSIVFAAPFLRPVAACWYVRTIVESNIR